MFFYPKIITLVLTSLISDVFLYFRTLRELLYCVDIIIIENDILLDNNKYSYIKFIMNNNSRNKI